MGIRLIIKGADFSANAVSHSGDYSTMNYGTSKSLWSTATSNTPLLSLGIGYISPRTGILDSLDILAAKDGSIKVYVQDPVSGTEKAATSANVVAGEQTIALGGLPVNEGEYIMVRASEAGVTKFGNASGDVPSVTDGLVDRTTPHAFTFQFAIIYEEN